jgi:hypothetical protein
MITSKVAYTSGGAAVLPVNENLGSSNIIDTNFYSGATTIVLDATNEKPLLEVAFETNHFHPFKGSLILRKGDTITIAGKSKNIGDTIHAVFVGYEVTAVI